MGMANPKSTIFRFPWPSSRYVLRFEVSVDHPIGVGGQQSLTHLLGYPQEFGKGKRSLLNP